VLDLLRRAAKVLGIVVLAVVVLTLVRRLFGGGGDAAVVLDEPGLAPPREPTPTPTPAPIAAPTADGAERTVPPYVTPEPGGACTELHPVKVKLASGIYHVPGGANYARTSADRCYLSAGAAEADGFRAAKR
jgi:hypothetical protein